MLWINGALCPLEAARISPLDRGFTRGDGLFETIRVRAGEPVHLPAHLHRLAAGGQVLGLAVPGADTVRAGIMELLAATSVRDGSVRLTVARGEGPRGLLPPTETAPTCTMVATTGHFGRSDVRALTSRLIRRDEASPLSRIKSLNYLPAILARQEAARAGLDEAVLLNIAGRVAENTIRNLVVAHDGHVFTPPVSEGALPGTARGSLITAGLVQEAPLTLEQLRCAQGVWLVNSLSLRVLTELDGAAVAVDRERTQRLAVFLDSGGLAPC